MSINYDSMRKMASGMIAGANRVQYTLIKIDENDTRTEYKFQAIQTAVKTEEIDGTLVQHGDLKLVTECDVPAEPDDRITMMMRGAALAREFRVMKLERVEPGGINIINKIFVRA